MLVSGRDDYLVTVNVRDVEDFERVHRQELARLPEVARIDTSLAIRTVVDRPVPPAALAPRGR